ncbi:MAG: restriction endonuclease subunit S [Verrucomicrobia bacterium]|nr:restriction endonuclease subunit S [Verrucomicrobiota bacterium]
MSQWREVLLADVADFRNGKAISPEKYTAKGKHPVFGSNGQIARSDDVLNFHPVVVVGRVGAYCGCVHYVSEASWVTDNAIVVLPKEENDVRYLFYLLGSLELERTAIGSAQPLMTQSGLKAVRTSVPPPTEQRAITAVLGALDDKIELNRRMNETLEALAHRSDKSLGQFKRALKELQVKVWRRYSDRSKIGEPTHPKSRAKCYGGKHGVC